MKTKLIEAKSKAQQKLDEKIRKNIAELHAISKRIENRRMRRNGKRS